MTNELKPCPFCGGKASLTFHESSNVTVFDAVVYCDEGCCERNADYAWNGDRVAAADRAIAAWNTRPSPAPTVSVEECDQAYLNVYTKAEGSSVDARRAGIQAVMELCVSRLTGAATRSETIEEAFREGWQAGMNQVDRDGDNASTPDEAWNASDAKKSHLASVVGEARPSFEDIDEDLRKAHRATDWDPRAREYLDAARDKIRAALYERGAK